MNRDRRLLKLTLKYTERSLHRYPMAAIVAHGSRPISFGVNLDKSHPLQELVFNPNRTIHAELSAIRSLTPEALKGATIYICRRTAEGIGLAKPCKVCEKKIIQSGIKRVIYSVSGPADMDICEYGVIEL